MKLLLTLVTLALAALAIEEKAREAAADAHDAYDGAVTRARDAQQTVVQKIEQQPLVSLIVAGGLGYAAAAIVPKRG